MSFNKWMNKQCYIHTIEYYLAIKRNKPLIHRTVWMTLKCIWLSERSQFQRASYCLIPFIWLRKRYNYRKEKQISGGPGFEEKDERTGNNKTEDKRTNSTVLYWYSDISQELGGQFWKSCTCALVFNNDVSGWPMVEVGFSLVKWEVIDKQREKQKINCVNGFESKALAWAHV